MVPRFHVLNEKFRHFLLYICRLLLLHPHFLEINWQDSTTTWLDRRRISSFRIQCRGVFLLSGAHLSCCEQISFFERREVCILVSFNLTTRALLLFRKLHSERRNTPIRPTFLHQNISHFDVTHSCFLTSVYHSWTSLTRNTFLMLLLLSRVFSHILTWQLCL